MIKFVAFLFGLSVQANNSFNSSLQTCTHESNYGYFSQDATLRIVGGIPAEENQWPFIVQLTSFVDVGNSSEVKDYCGGTIVDDYWVLTYDFL